MLRTSQGAQLGVACLGLTYSTDSDTTAVLLRDGNVNIMNLSTFFPYLSTDDNYAQDARWAANK